jgi:polar amino acid transport system substrate-binding protein
VNLTSVITLCFITIIAGCTRATKTDIINFAICPDYPPFEYKSNGELLGFDIELASLIATELGKTAKFTELQFNTLLLSLNSSITDAVIATMTATDKRKHNFSFSDPYYKESLSIVSKQTSPLTTIQDLENKIIVCQIGTSMELWLKTNAPSSTKIISMNTNPEAIEAVKSGQADGALLDSVQATAFGKGNAILAHKTISQSNTGYSIVVKKDSNLKEQINKALKTLRDNGAIKKLEDKYLG